MNPPLWGMEQEESVNISVSTSKKVAAEARDFNEKLKASPPQSRIKIAANLKLGINRAKNLGIERIKIEFIILPERQ
jgi:hypothetical protein